uniref:Uncharacterized protein n=1 Tax=viral metagenome TaxID=1070528 RepID=A0A6M3IEV0_9ZZZZ
MKHEYSDDCTCVKCTNAWNKALFAAVDRGEARKKKLNEKPKSQTKKGRK